MAADRVAVCPRIRVLGRLWSSQLYVHDSAASEWDEIAYRGSAAPCDHSGRYRLRPSETFTHINQGTQGVLFSRSKLAVRSFSMRKSHERIQLSSRGSRIYRLRRQPHPIQKICRAPRSHQRRRRIPEDNVAVRTILVWCIPMPQQALDDLRVPFRVSPSNALEWRPA